MLTEKPIGICPACGETVKADEDCVWTSRCNLYPENPFFSSDFCTWDFDTDPSVLDFNHAERCTGEKNLMPLHSACYEKGDY